MTETAVHDLTGSDPTSVELLPRDWQAQVLQLAAERDAVILAHNYQLAELQDVADFTGDSLQLSREAAAAEAEVIAFCGVHFMAETASILSPEKTVLLPDMDAGCSLADSITAEQLRAWKAQHPGAVVVMYVNTSAAVKAETDYCCTSANAVAVVEHILREHGPDTEILFGPDMFLGAYVERRIGRALHVWDGECHVHAGIRPRDIEQVRAAHPGAHHPARGVSGRRLRRRQDASARLPVARHRRPGRAQGVRHLRRADEPGRRARLPADRRHPVRAPAPVHRRVRAG